MSKNKTSKNEIFGFKLVGKVNLTSLAMIIVKLKYGDTEVDYTDKTKNSSILCRQLLNTIDYIFAYPLGEDINVITKQVISFNVNQHYLESALLFSIRARMAPNWIYLNNRKTYFFNSNEFFKSSGFKECIELVGVKLNENEINIYLLARLGNINFLRIDRLGLSAETLNAYKSSTKGSVIVNDTFCYSIPNLTHVQLIRFSKSLNSLPNHGNYECVDNLADEWLNLYGINLPDFESQSQTDSSSSSYTDMIGKYFFCQTLDSFTFYGKKTFKTIPSCCLLQENITFIKSKTQSTIPIFSFLFDLKMNSKFENLIESSLLAMSEPRIDFANGALVRNMIVLKDGVLSKLNRATSLDELIPPSVTNPPKPEIENTKTNTKQETKSNKPKPRRTRKKSNNENGESNVKPKTRGKPNIKPTPKPKPKNVEQKSSTIKELSDLYSQESSSSKDEPTTTTTTTTSLKNTNSFIDLEFTSSTPKKHKLNDEPIETKKSKKFKKSNVDENNNADAFLFQDDESIEPKQKKPLKIKLGFLRPNKCLDKENISSNNENQPVASTSTSTTTTLKPKTSSSSTTTKNPTRSRKIKSILKDLDLDKAEPSFHSTPLKNLNV